MTWGYLPGEKSGPLYQNIKEKKRQEFNCLTWRSEKSFCTLSSPGKVTSEGKVGRSYGCSHRWGQESQWTWPHSSCRDQLVRQIHRLIWVGDPHPERLTVISILTILFRPETTRWICKKKKMGYGLNRVSSLKWNFASLFPIQPMGVIGSKLMCT